MDLTLTNLENCFKAAKEEGTLFIGIAVKVGNQVVPEVIINSQENFDTKLEYYKSAYNENLTLKANAAVRIVGFTHDDFTDNIICDLL